MRGVRYLPKGVPILKRIGAVAPQAVCVHEHRVHITQRDLDSLFVVPDDVVVHRLDELLDGDRLPIPRVKHLVF